MKLRLLGLFALGCLAGCGAASGYDPAPQQHAESEVGGGLRQSEAASATPDAFDPVLIDVEGLRYQPFADAKTKALVLVFVLPDCPIANSVMPELNRLQAEYAAQGVFLALVHADAETTAEAARQHAQEYKVVAPAVLDPQHEWVKLAGATTTPEAAVFTRGGELAYRGRINDQYVALGKRRQQTTKHDLRDALAAILAGLPVPEPRTEPIGCPIPEL
jgi:hypothetical protein